jgi:hypothetical protein
MFDFAPVGVPLALIMVLYMSFFHFLLPKRVEKDADMASGGPASPDSAARATEERKARFFVSYFKVRPRRTRTAAMWLVLNALLRAAQCAVASPSACQVTSVCVCCCGLCRSRPCRYSPRMK